jgi:hypothetical protein
MPLRGLLNGLSCGSNRTFIKVRAVSNDRMRRAFPSLALNGEDGEHTCKVYVGSRGNDAD